MTFSFKRVFDLARVFVVTQRRSILVSFGAVYAVLLAIFLLGLLTGAGWGSGLEYHQVFFSATFVVAGLIAASVSFASMHRADRSYAYLTLPASHVEKLVEKLVLIAVVYPITAIATYFVFSAALTGLSPLLVDEPFVLFDPVKVGVAEIVRNFIVTSSLFLFGAAYFRSRHFIKTVLAIAAVAILLSLVGAGAGFAALSDLIRGFESGAYGDAVADPRELEQLGRTFASVARTGRFLAMWVLPPVMWLLTWLRLREAEVSDAVR
jgi:hypothetical protein